MKWNAKKKGSPNSPDAGSSNISSYLKHRANDTQDSSWSCSNRHDQWSEWLLYCDVESKWKTYHIVTVPGQSFLKQRKMKDASPGDKTFHWNGVCLLCGTFCILRSAHTVYLCVLCGSENKQRLFHCTTLTDRLVLITETECVYCAVRSTCSAHTVCLCVLCGSQNKQLLFDCTALTGWFF